jgi:predicted nucleic acid-binding Zn ribbon protein
MPMFDLICKECRHKEDDVLVGVGEDRPKCAKCGSEMNINYENMEYGIIKRGDGWTAGAGSARRKG